MRERQLLFLGSWRFAWLLLAAMIVCYVAASAVGASGRNTSYAIGMLGMAAIVFGAAYSWLLFFRLEPHERERVRNKLYFRENRVWTGPLSTLGRWLSQILGLVGWISVLILTVWSLSN
jgi:hypothetical protein